MSETAKPPAVGDAAVTDGPDAGAAESRAGLDDVMIAMDVVDTLRHDDFLVARELDGEARRQALVDRLREIYRSQGIEVPDRILEEGVDALEQDRFVYTPPRDGLSTRLAKLYVSRGTWGRYLAGAMAVVVVLWGGFYLLYDRPRQSRQAEIAHELKVVLPQDLKRLQDEIGAEVEASGQTGLLAGTRAEVRRGTVAATAGDLKVAREARAALKDQLDRLRARYTVRIVSRRGEKSGVWRIPKINRGARNYYLVVEAIDGDGHVVPQTVTNEETGQRETVKTWAVRVPQAEYDKVRADKAADGIINDNVVAVKRRGFIEPEWRIPVSGGAITKW